MQVLTFLLLIVLLFLLYPLYQKRIQEIINSKYTAAFFTSVKKAKNYIKEFIRISYLRSDAYAVFQNIRPYEEAVKELNACKYFKFAGTADIGKDILELQFCILGISSEYKTCLADLSLLLAQLLNDFYVERLGIKSPYVYTALLQEGELKMWAAKNAYGNALIQKQASRNDWKDKPNTKDLEDD